MLIVLCIAMEDQMTQAQEVLKKHFGYESFRPQQEDIINTVLSKRDAFVLMPTGGGKSLCYQVPALLLPGITLVISPLISLMKDQVDTLVANGIKAAFLNSSLTNSQADNISKLCRMGEIKILYISPEKAIASADWFLKSLPVDLIAIDEAHCISSWGHDFRPEYKQLHQLRNHHPNATMMALTATADRLTQKDILEFLGLNTPEIFISSFDRPNLQLSVKFGLKAKEKFKDILDVLEQHPNSSGIIYCTSKKNTEALAGELQHAGVKAAYYHAGMNSEQRSKIQENFIRDEIQVVCATIAFGMGIDKSNVRFVLHYNLPKTIESYYQEIGRGGRDGMPCFTRLYWSFGDLILLRQFADESGAQQVNVEKLNRMQEFAESRICRRKVLLNYFGENLRENCGNCDVCKNPPSHFDGTILTQKALSAIRRAETIQQKLTVPLLINVLRGSQQHEIIEKNLQTIKTYGAGKDLSYQEWNYYVLQMIQVGSMHLLYETGNALEITPFGDMILKNQFTVDLIKPQEYVPQEKKKASDKKSAPALSDKSSSLFEELRAHRKRLASLEDVPPYVIFHDSTLHEMVERLPLTPDEMLEISGMSEHKFKKYGYDFLDLIVKNSPVPYKPKVNVEKALMPAIIQGYIDEINALQIPLTTTTLTKLLLGSQDEKFESFATKVSFYGILRDEFKVKELFEKLRNYVEPVVNQIQDEKQQQLYNTTDTFLKKLGDRKLSEKDLVFFQEKAKALPLPDKDRMSGSESTPRRTGMKWSEQELQLLEDLLCHTSDIKDFETILERTEKSIRFALLNYSTRPISEFTS
jgi:ATP-dependent DNA helicase RecQ